MLLPGLNASIKWICMHVKCQCFFYLRLRFPKEWLFDRLSQRGGAERCIVLISVPVAQLTLLQLAHFRKVTNMIQG